MTNLWLISSSKKWKDLSRGQLRERLNCQKSMNRKIGKWEAISEAKTEKFGCEVWKINLELATVRSKFGSGILIE